MKTVRHRQILGEFVAVEADSGAMGGSQSQEFMVYTDAGEDLIASCAKCGYAANMEKATSRLEPINELAPTGDGKPELVHTPGKAAIAARAGAAATRANPIVAGPLSSLCASSARQCSNNPVTEKASGQLRLTVCRRSGRRPMDRTSLNIWVNFASRDRSRAA